MSTARKTRGRQTERIVADYLSATLFPYAEPIGSSAPGRDITGTPGVAIEVKARRSLNIPDWLRQAVKNRKKDLPVLIHRPDGYGPERIDQWPVTMPMAYWVQLMREAGYGQAPTERLSDGTDPASLRS